MQMWQVLRAKGPVLLRGAGRAFTLGVVAFNVVVAIKLNQEIGFYYAHNERMRAEERQLWQERQFAVGDELQTLETRLAAARSRWLEQTAAVEALEKKEKQK